MQINVKITHINLKKVHYIEIIAVHRILDNIK